MSVLHLFSKNVFKSNGIKLCRRLTTEQVRLSYETFHNTDCKLPPIVILHGLLDQKENWSEIGQELCLKTSRTVITIDARNHGSSEHSPYHDYRVLSSDVKNFLDKMKLKKVSLLGHSMGGKTAMITALLNPEQISSLVIVDISPVTMIGFNNTKGFSKLADTIMSMDFSGINNLSEAIEYANVKLKERGIKQIGYVTRNIVVKPDKTIGWTINTKVLLKNYQKLTLFPYLTRRVYPNPTLFIGASKTAFLNPEDLSHIYNQFPNTILRYVRGVGHNIHVEDPTTLMKFASDFLREH